MGVILISTVTVLLREKKSVANWRAWYGGAEGRSLDILTNELEEIIAFYIFQMFDVDVMCPISCMY